MRLKELEIQGFKSFPDKTRITIGEGITGVVGPNGSGKATFGFHPVGSGRNQLQTAARCGQDGGRYFGGTQTRGAMGYAAVSLTIDNSDHGLEMDADEVTIGRRYYRSGESEYTINGQSVRLKRCVRAAAGYRPWARSTPLWVRGALRRSLVQNPPSGARFLRKHLALPNTATAKMKPSAAWPRRRAIWNACGIFWGAGKAGWTLKRDSEKAEQFLAYSETRKGWKLPCGGFNPPRTGYGAGPAAQV